MELIVAPIAELRPQITRLFEEVVHAALQRPAGGSRGANAFSCGLSGGSTALIFLGALRDASVDWSHITLYWADERAVPPDHPDSNYGLAERLLLSPLGGRAPQAVRMPAELPDLAQAAAQYDRALPAALDLLILGVGDDGHVCSLFPNHPVLNVRDTRVAAIENSPKPPPRRLTLTMPYVVSSRRIWIVALGARKLPVLQQAVSRQTITTPLDMVTAQAKSVTVFTDEVMRRR
jgi:6-phosphogluconolactonase